MAIAVNAFLALREPELEALSPEGFDPVSNLVRIHRNTKRSNDEELPVVGPLREIMTAGGWNQINLRIAEREIVKTRKGRVLEMEGLVRIPPWHVDASLEVGNSGRGGGSDPSKLC